MAGDAAAYASATAVAASDEDADTVSHECCWKGEMAEIPLVAAAEPPPSPSGVADSGVPTMAACAESSDRCVSALLCADECEASRGRD